MSTSPLPLADTVELAVQIEATPGLSRLRALFGEPDAIGPDIVAAVVEEAAKFSQSWLGPLNPRADREGCRLDDGRVRTATGHKAAWDAYLEAGWLGIDQPHDAGGQGLPIFVLAACQELFDRGCIAFGMLPTALRAAARLLAAHADEATKAEWLPKLVSGKWGATICISEPDAGSDVGRIRTLASPTDGGEWSITGEKIWISYGDHDLAGRIGHCLLARTPDAPPGAAGLSLFLVPDTVTGADGEMVRNGIVVRRLEEKLGLHGSPTCAMGFEGARGRLIGAPGRGLAQLFTMITTMRLMVAVQGLALAGGAADVALAYAEERRQGGPADQPPVAIAEHSDIRRLLMGMVARVQLMRGVILAAAVHADLARLEPDLEAREAAEALVGWLLPIAKTLGGETAFEVSSDAIQVLGGAGYVKDWPAEQLLRDSRVFTIFEGASGIQALDLLLRRLRRDGGKGLRAFMALARAELSTAGGPIEARAQERTLDLLQDAADRLSESTSDAAAYPFLRLAGLAAMGWIAVRLASTGSDHSSSQRLAAAARYWLQELEPKARLEHSLACADPERLDLFEQVRRRP